MESIIIPEAVTNIGDDSFAGCKSLTSVIIPKNVTTIGTCAFLSCTGLTSITIPENVTTIGSRAFRGCTNLVSIDIPDGVNCIGNDAFYSTPWYDNQPDGLVYAGKVAYKYKGEMPEGTQIVIKEGTKGLSQNMFEICPGLSSIFIPKSVTYISDHIFDDLNNLISIVIEEGNCVYDSRDGCNAIIETATNTLVLGCQNTVIPDDVLQIGDFAFWLCRGLTSITIPEGVRSIGYASFYGCNGLESITIPNNVTSIDKKTFMNCRKLKSITLGSSLKNIKVEAFWECWPTFLACYAEIPPTCDIMTFAGTPEKCTLYVPKNSIDAYKSAEIWKKFVSIKDISEAETSINTTIAKENANSIYDLQGRKVNSQLRKKGIYIQNGKKSLDIRP
ncbi:MAG: leucine-rich repeat domain-containing protein [Bacteroidaceae bacterium]|nr:leucine-rich repeat domain-containing protein [Bacteroidaceae bacterium]